MPVQPSIPVDPPAVFPSAVLYPSMVRTFVPLIVGLLLSLTIFSNANTAAVTELATALFSALYYVIARLLEHFVSKSFGWMLGYPAVPVYPKP